MSSERMICSIFMKEHTEWFACVYKCYLEKMYSCDEGSGHYVNQVNPSEINAYIILNFINKF
ncbi:hypothetical protein Scep_025106 [Stephania cephalantha]|uniref:Uncharacterized protein n=1 Tax=Stephania cephalantha TaxID=152367 RepID=A0AAP0EXS3_9MAGN